MNHLTERQRFVLQQIIRLMDEKGYPPTFRELGDAIGVKSTNGVSDHLRALERKGFIETGDTPGRTRAIRLLGPASAYRPVIKPQPVVPRQPPGQILIPFRCPNCKAETFARHKNQTCVRLLGFS